MKTATTLPRPHALALAALLAAGGLSTAQAQLRPSPQLGAGRLVPATPAGSPAQPQIADHIVAIVNSEPITNNEVRARMVRVEQQMTQQGAALPPRPELARQVLDRLISEKAQLQMAQENGIKVDEPMVDQVEQNVARQNQVDVAELRRRMANEGISVAAFRDDLRNQIMLQRVREREIEPRVRVTDLDVDQYIREQALSGGAAPAEINLAQVLVAVPENAAPALVAELQQKAERIQARAAKGDDFSALAREFSDAPGAATTGGAFGLRTADRYPAIFIESTQALNAGGVSKVVRSGAGFHVLKVLEKRQAGLPGVAVVQTHARHILLRPGPQMSELAARRQLADIKRRVEAGQADFAQLAKEVSQDTSASRGGDLGWANPGLFVPEFEDVLNNLKPGQIAEPMSSRFGLHLIQLLERREATLSQREQRDMARQMVRERKLEETYLRWVQEVRGRSYIELREPPQVAAQ